jgi:hypothetical protein
MEGRSSLIDGYLPFCSTNSCRWLMRYTHTNVKTVRITSLGSGWGDSLHPSRFTTYHLTRDDSGYHFQHIWKAKLPYKIKIITWLLENNAVLMKDNMTKRKWTDNPTCVFCNQLETRDHLFFQSSVASCVWGIVATWFVANMASYAISSEFGFGDSWQHDHWD